MKYIYLIMLSILLISCSGIKASYKVYEIQNQYHNPTPVLVQEGYYKSTKDVSITLVYDPKTNFLMMDLKSVASPVIRAKGDVYKDILAEGGNTIKNLLDAYLSLQTGGFIKSNAKETQFGYITAE